MQPAKPFGRQSSRVCRRLGGASSFLDGFSSSLAALGIVEGLLRGGQVVSSSICSGVGIGHTHSLLSEDRGFGDASLVQNFIRGDEGSSKAERRAGGRG